MAQLLGKMRVSPGQNPGFFDAQCHIYDTVTMTWRTETVIISNANARDKALLQATLNSALGVIDFTQGAPPTP